MNRLLFLLLLILCGCTALNDSMTPSAEAYKDEYSGDMIVNQQPVPVDGEPFSLNHNLLGFQWKSSYPNSVILSVHVLKHTTIYSMGIKADGMYFIPYRLKGGTIRTGGVRYRPRASYYRNPLSRRPRELRVNGLAEEFPALAESRRDFALSLNDFRKIANAGRVILRVECKGGQSDSSYTKGDSSVVALKYRPFLEQVDKYRQQLGFDQAVKETEPAPQKP